MSKEFFNYLGKINMVDKKKVEKKDSLDDPDVFFAR